ncbi:MAG TPA: hypothetical protein VK540_34360 [Polyangiaceae bacterium]|nr:hypothetical protein [Polyangiaceae bacterium]
MDVSDAHDFSNPRLESTAGSDDRFVDRRRTPDLELTKHIRYQIDVRSGGFANRVVELFGEDPSYALVLDARHNIDESSDEVEVIRHGHLKIRNDFPEMVEVGLFPSQTAQEWMVSDAFPALEVACDLGHPTAGARSVRFGDDARRKRLDGEIHVEPRLTLLTLE